MSSNITDLDQEWNIISMDILRLRNMVEGVSEPGFTADDHLRIYTTIYGLCLDSVHSEQLYHKYRESIEEYITSTVLPKLKENRGELLLREFVRRWEIHKKLVRIMSNLFRYLERHYIPGERILGNALPMLTEVGFMCFHDLVYPEIKINLMNAVVSLIDREREGEEIYRALLQNVLDVCIEMGMGDMNLFRKKFDECILQQAIELTILERLFHGFYRILFLIIC